MRLSKLVSQGLLAVAVAGCSAGAGEDREPVAAFSDEVCAQGGLVADDADYFAPPGTMVKWTASASCEVGDTPEYKFWVLPPGGSWTVWQDWSTTDFFDSDTTGLATGSYNVQVWIRAQGSPSTYETWKSRPFTLANVTKCSSVSSATSPSGQTTIGATVGITSSASCGASTPEYKVWHLAPGGSWAVAADWTTSPMYNWATTGAPAGTHNFQVWARALGSPADYDTYTSFYYSLATACNSVSNAFSPAGSTLPGNPVSITANASCGGTANYAFWMKAPGGAWSEVQPMGASNVYNWDTTAAAPGVYSFQTWVRNQGSPYAYEAYGSSTYTLLTGGAACTGATLDASPASPQSVGTPVQLTGGAASCTAAEFKFWKLPPGGSWAVVQDWSASPTYDWATGSEPTGNFLFQVWARQVGSTASYETYRTKSYTLN